MYILMCRINRLGLSFWPLSQHNCLTTKSQKNDLKTIRLIIKCSQSWDNPLWWVQGSILWEERWNWLEKCGDRQNNECPKRNTFSNMRGQAVDPWIWPQGGSHSNSYLLDHLLVLIWVLNSINILRKWSADSLVTLSMLDQWVWMKYGNGEGGGLSL